MRMKVKNVISIITSLVITCALPVNVSGEWLVDYVNPLVGTALRGEGGTAPFVGMPHMMTNFLAQTRENKMGTMAYVYDDTHIMGFMASHQPTVWMGDYGYVSIMPQIGREIKTLPEKRALSFSHNDEKSTPYRYSVMMRDGKERICAEMTAAKRCGLMRFTFPRTGTSRLIIQAINLNEKLSDWCNDYQPRLKTVRGWIKVDAARGEIIGYNPDRQSAQLGPELKNFRGYFVIKLSEPISSYGVWNGDSIIPAKSESMLTRGGAYVEFDTKKGETVEVAVSTSFISIEQARTNMAKEIAGKTFEEVARATKEAWEQKLGKMKVHSKSADDKKIFYTALYHSYLFPREFSEYGRYYSAFDDKVHDGVSHNDYSLWDTFRALHPLMTILEPKLTCEWITSLLQMYKEGGWMPMWPNPTYTNIMVGTHADAVIADAYMKGLRDYDVNLAYEAMRKDAMVPPDCDTKRWYGDRNPWTAYEGRAGASWYHSIGYVPDDHTAESVSRTLEYAYDDWCVAQVAKDLGKTADYANLMRWSKNYRNLYNEKEGFMLPRKYNGDWIVLDDNSRQGLTEGSKWTYLFCVLQDVPGMIDLMGGNSAFAAKLDRNFNEGHYCHDNEPGHHYIYLYDYCGMPCKAQELVRKHTRINYRNAPDGLNGNDDCGQMSAWYLFSVMGFYPVTPGSNTFALGAPQFPEIDLTVTADGAEKVVRIVADNISEKNKYVRSVSIDGAAINGNFITYRQLMNAGTIRFVMTDTPVKK